MQRLALGAVVAAAVWVCACGSVRYTPPTEGPTAVINVASVCTERASFYGRINGLRTEEYGCNQGAEWVVTPGAIDMTIQVHQASFSVEPLSLGFELEEGECIAFLLRQTAGFDLEFLSRRPCAE